MSLQEVAASKSPEHTDTRQAGIAGSKNVYIAVAYIDSIFLRHAQLTQRLFYSIGSRLLADAFRLMLTNSHFDCVGKEMSAQFFCSSIKLIAYHSGATTSMTQLSEELWNVVVWTRSVK